MVASLGIVATLAACAGTAPDDDTDDADRFGGTAVIGIAETPTTLNPGVTTEIGTLEVWSKVYEGLVWVSPDGLPNPELATEWEVSEDGLDYVFTLREDVVWHDGEEFTSDDVVYSMTEGLLENTRAQGVLGKIAEIEAPDEHTVEITLTEPYAPFISQMKVLDVPILPEHIGATAASLADSPLGDAPVGTGAFQFESWDVGSAVTLARFDDYWGERTAYLDEIIIQTIPDAAIRSLALETGEIDFLGSGLPASEIPRLSETDGVAVVTQDPNPNPWIGFLWINGEHEALGSVEVRQAMAMAIDRERIVTQAMGGQAAPAEGAFGNGFQWLMPEGSGYDELYPHDVEAAQELLDEAGWADGFSLRLITLPGSPADAVTEIIRENLAEIGIEITIVPLERGLMTDAVYTTRDYDLAYRTYVSSGDPAIGYHRLYRSNPEIGAVNQNPTYYANEEVDELLADAEEASDYEVRGDYYRQAQEILNEDIPVLVLFEGLATVASNASLVDAGLGQTSYERWQDAYFVD